MKSALRSIAAFAALAPLALAAPAHADHHGKKSGAAMPASRTIVETAVATPSLSTLVAAVKAADLVDTLSGTGPFTVFAPSNAAFEKLPAGTVETLLRPENKAQLQSVLTYHVVPGRVTSGDLVKLINANDGHAVVTTVQGGKLVARLVGGKIVLTDAAGGRSTVAAADLKQSNGVVHVIDSVVLPG